MLMIISPAKTFDLSKENIAGVSGEIRFKEETKELIEILKGYSKSELSLLMKMSDKLAVENFERYEKFYTDDIKSKEAILSFDGAVFKGIKVESFSKDDLLFINDNLRILSGLYGVIKPLDKIKEYRLEMGTKLGNPKGKTLYKYWENKLTNCILEEIKNSSNEKVLINLASNEYSKALNLKEISKKYKVLNVEFKELRGEEYKVVGTYAKRARGLMVNYIVKNKITSVNDIKSFVEDGYKLNEKLSSENELIFTRDK